MKNGIFGVAAIFSLSLAGESPVMAEEMVETTSVATNQRPFLDQVADYAALSYAGVYRGAPLSNLKSTLQPGVNGLPDESSPQHLENLITAGYKVNKDTVVGVLGHFYYFPVGNPAGTGQDLQMLDPALIVNRANFFNVGDVKVNGRFTAQAPLTSADFLVPRNLATALTGTLISTYQVPSTSLTVGVFTYLRGYIPTASAADNVRTYKIYVAPNANYQLTKTVALTLWVDWIQASRNGGTGFFSGLQNDPIDIEPGINWDITKNISINPIINIYPSNPTLAATSLQAFISAKAF